MSVRALVGERVVFIAQLGSSFIDRTDIRFGVNDSNGNVVLAQSTSGVMQAVPGSGLYFVVKLLAPPLPAGFAGVAVWDTSSGPPIAVEDFYVAAINADTPQNVKVTSDRSPDHLSIAWDPVVGATGYLVYRGLSQNKSDMRIVSIEEITVFSEPVIRGASEVGLDALLASDVWKVLRVGPQGPGSITPGAEDFLDGVDFVHILNAVDWRTRNRQPVTGDTYFVDYIRRDVKAVAAPLTTFVDPYAHGRLRTFYWYSVAAISADGVISDLSEPATLLFTASSQPVRDFNQTLRRL